VNTDASAQATVDAPGGDSRTGLSPGWVKAGATILALAIRPLTRISALNNSPSNGVRYRPVLAASHLA
jgi:hypothetical protein